MDRPQSADIDLVIAWLRARFPELRRDVEDWWDEEGLLHVLFGTCVVGDWLVPRLDGTVDDETRLVEMFELIERMAGSADADLQNVVEVTICESLGDDEARLNRAYRLMGPDTRRLSDSAEKGLGRDRAYFRWIGPADGPRPPDR